MKIYILPVSKDALPESLGLSYPSHNKDFGVEQDFYNYILKQEDLLTNNPEVADWHYLPVFWTRFWRYHDHGRIGYTELRDIVNVALIDDKKTFTLCQYANGTFIDIGSVKAFYSSRVLPDGMDMPLLCSEHKVSSLSTEKKYKASFVGRFLTHEIRQELYDRFSEEKKFFIKDGFFSTEFFVNNIMESYVSLCPRGYGGGSYRFFESMQLGVVPMLIGDIDVRPFKTQLDWDSFSFYARNVDEAETILDSCTEEKFLSMGLKAKEAWYNQLKYGKWCRYVFNELEVIS